jgi:hypothetical protein
MHKQADGKVRRSQEEWERIFERFHSSGMTGAAFCRREKIAKGSFEKWKKKVGQESKAVAVVPTFIEWPTPSDAAPTSSMNSPALSPGELELSFPGGVTLRWKS